MHAYAYDYIYLYTYACMTMTTYLYISYIFVGGRLRASSLTTPDPTGINFPSYAFENQAETEGFAKMAKRAGYQVFGLPNYVVWHVDTDEKPGNA